MKIAFRLLLCGVLVSTFTSCSEDEPVSVADVQPDRLEEVDYERKFLFDDQNRVSEIIVSSELPGSLPLVTSTEYFYDQSGRMERSLATTGYEMKYSYHNERINRTDEFIDGQFSQYHAFAYDQEGRLSEIVSWQDIPEEGGWIPHAKTIYLYDANYNLSTSILYSYNTATDQHEVLTTFEFSEYDSKPCADNLFDAIAINPLIEFRKNNPGKLVIKNKNGVTSSIETYEYTYGDRGFPQERNTTTTLLHNGSTGSYITKYFYKQ